MGTVCICYYFALLFLYRVMSDPTVNRLHDALRACRGSFLAVGFFSMFVNLLMLTPAFYMLQVYGRVVTSGSVPTLVMLTIIMAALMITMGLLEWTRSRLMVRISTQLDQHLSSDVYQASFNRALASGGMDTILYVEKAAFAGNASTPAADNGDLVTIVLTGVQADQLGLDNDGFLQIA